MVIEFWKTNENAITCYKSKPNKCTEVFIKLVKAKKRFTNKQAITVESLNGEIQSFPSVIEASKSLGMNYSTLCCYVNGKSRNTTDYKFNKSPLNI